MLSHIGAVDIQALKSFVPKDVSKHMTCRQIMSQLTGFYHLSIRMSADVDLTEIIWILFCNNMNEFYC